MKVTYSDEFLHDFRRLPVKIQSLFRVQEERIKLNANDPRLHSKKLVGDPVTFSFRVTISYRVLYCFKTPSEIIFLVIGHRKDVYRK